VLWSDIHRSVWNGDSRRLRHVLYSLILPFVDQRGEASSISPALRDGGQQVSQDTSNHSFDELARGLASGTLSRGKALKVMGAALVGGALGSLGGVASADQGDQGENEECKPEGKKCKNNHQCCSGKCEGGTCQPAETQFTCICGLTQERQTCSSVPCGDPDSISVVCTPLCEQHGSVFTGGRCDNVPCEV
jgi:hypothetical protein